MFPLSAIGFPGHRFHPGPSADFRYYSVLIKHLPAIVGDLPGTSPLHRFLRTKNHPSAGQTPSAVLSLQGTSSVREYFRVRADLTCHCSPARHGGLIDRPAQPTRLGLTAHGIGLRRSPSLVHCLGGGTNI